VAGGLLLLCAPWTLLLPAALAGSWRSPEARAERWLACWIGAALLPFLFASSGFERYALPALPPALILCARAARRAPAAARVARIATAAWLALAGAALLAACLHFGIGSAPALAACAAALCVCVAMLPRAAGLRTPALAFLAFQSVFFGCVYPALGINRLPPGLAQEIGARPVAHFGPRPPALLAMALRRPLRHVELEPAALDAFAAAGGWIAVSGEGRGRLEHELARLGYGWQVMREWSSLHTRSTALRVFRRDARDADLREALAAGSLAGLEERFALLGRLERRAP
jgi:hypothetical protein